MKNVSIVQQLLFFCLLYFGTTEILSISLPFVVRSNEELENLSPFRRTVNFHLLSHLPLSFHNCYRHSSSVFSYFNNDLANKLSLFPVEYELVNCSVEDLLSNKLSSSFHYYSGNIMQDIFQDFRSHIDISSLFSAPDLLEGLTANIWISPPSIKASLHYDAVFNLFVQVSGKKKVILYPPYRMKEFLIYGRNHPMACQSRWRDFQKKRSFEEEGKLFYSIKYQKLFSSISSKICQAKSIHEFVNTMSDHDDTNGNYTRPSKRQDKIEILLNEDDILFIPPFWLHEVLYSSFFNFCLFCFLPDIVCFLSTFLSFVLTD
jgi:hypothetical protein